MAINIYILTGYIKNDDGRPNTEIVAEDISLPYLEKIKSLLESDTEKDFDLLQDKGIAIANYRNLRIAEVRYLD